MWFSFCLFDCIYLFIRYNICNKTNKIPNLKKQTIQSCTINSQLGLLSYCNWDKCIETGRMTPHHFKNNSLEFFCTKLFQDEAKTCCFHFSVSDSSCVSCSYPLCPICHSTSRSALYLMEVCLFELLFCYLADTNNKTPEMKF